MICYINVAFKAGLTVCVKRCTWMDGLADEKVFMAAQQQCDIQLITSFYTSNKHKELTQISTLITIQQVIVDFL